MPISPSKLPLYMGRIWTPSNTWFYGPSRVSAQLKEGYLDQFSRFAELTIVTDRQITLLRL